MSTAPAPAPALPELGLLERAVGYTRVALAAAPGADPTAPSPCSGWDLTALLRHMDESLVTLEQAGGTGSVNLAAGTARPRAAGAPRSVPALVADIRDRACALLAAWTSSSGEALISVAGSPLHAGVIAAAGSLEIAVHGWDVARTCGLDHPVPEALAEDLLVYLPLLVQPGDRPLRFAPEVPVPADAPAQQRLLAAVGRELPADS